MSDPYTDKVISRIEAFFDLAPGEARNVAVRDERRASCRAVICFVLREKGYSTGRIQAAIPYASLQAVRAAAARGHRWLSVAANKRGVALLQV